MHASWSELPVLFGDENSGLHGIDWGGQRLALLKLPAGVDVTPLFRGLPDDMCPAPHWGYLLKGRIRVVYTDGTEETGQAGEVCYLPPGHVPVVEEDAEFFEVSPPEAGDEVLAAFARNSAPVEEGSLRRRSIDPQPEP